MFDGLICGVLEVPEPDSRLLQTHVDGDLRRRNWGGQIAHAHQIVGGAGESENPIYLAHATMANFPHQRNRLQPAEAFVDSFPLSGGIDGRMQKIPSPFRPRVSANRTVRRSNSG
jgi:hypothetical protein